MAIEFICPNGHRLSTKDEDAGKMAKCPKCGAVTRVPGANGPAGKDSGVESLAVVSGSDKGLLAKAATGSGVGKLATGGGESSKSGIRLAGGLMGSPGNSPGAGQMASVNGGRQATQSGAEETIIFLCPNGHKLNAPRRMQGHAGKCPHCGAKFRIPFVDESGSADEGSRVDDLGNFHELLETAPTAPAAAPGSAQATAPPSAAKSPVEDFEFWGQQQPDQHPLAALVTRLWSEREHGGVIELHLTGGAIILPDWFERKLSQGAHGLFAAQSADGTVTMTIVPWETVTRVVVRNVVGLPDGMFE
jgi:hypothetical protein